MKNLHSIFNLKYRTICVILFIGGIKPLQVLSHRRPLQVLSPAILCFIFLFFYIFSNAQNSSEYNINDPRNPNCPCHKFQKIADDEYKKLLASANSNPVKLKKNIEKVQQNRNEVIPNPGIAQFELSQIQSEKIIGITDQGIANHEINSLDQGIANQEQVVSNKGLVTDSRFTKKKKNAYTKHRRKKRNCHYQKWTRIFDVKHWDVWKEFRDVSSCYHWK